MKNKKALDLFMDLGFTLEVVRLSNTGTLLKYQKDLPSPEFLNQEAYVEIRFVYDREEKSLSVDAIRRYRYIEYTNGINIHIGDRVDISPYLYPIIKQIEELEINIVDIYNEFKEDKTDEEV